MYYTAQARRILGGGGVDKHLESYYIVPKFPRRYYYTHYRRSLLQPVLQQYSAVGAHVVW